MRSSRSDAPVWRREWLRASRVTPASTRQSGAGNGSPRGGRGPLATVVSRALGTRKPIRGYRLNQPAPKITAIPAPSPT